MRIGLALDGVLCDTKALEAEWSRVLGEEKFLIDAAFWGALKPYEDVGEFGAFVRAKRWDLYVFAERPKAVLLATRAWIRNNLDLILDKDHLILPALKRYDCRIRGITTFIESDPAAIENLKVETVCPIAIYHVDRSNGGSLMDIAREIESIHLRS